MRYVRSANTSVLMRRKRPLAMSGKIFWRSALGGWRTFARGQDAVIENADWDWGLSLLSLGLVLLRCRLKKGDHAVKTILPRATITWRNFRPELTVL